MRKSGDKWRKSSLRSLFASLFQALFHIIMIIVGSVSKEGSDCHGTFLEAFGSILLILDMLNIGVTCYHEIPEEEEIEIKGPPKEFRCTHCRSALYVGPDTYKTNISGTTFLQATRFKV